MTRRHAALRSPNTQWPGQSQHARFPGPIPKRQTRRLRFLFAQAVRCREAQRGLGQRKPSSSSSISFLSVSISLWFVICLRPPFLSFPFPLRTCLSVTTSNLRFVFRCCRVVILHASSLVRAQIEDGWLNNVAGEAKVLARHGEFTKVDWECVSLSRRLSGYGCLSAACAA